LYIPPFWLYQTTTINTYSLSLQFLSRETSFFDILKINFLQFFNTINNSKIQIRVILLYLLKLIKIIEDNNISDYFNYLIRFRYDEIYKKLSRLFNISLIECPESFDILNINSNYITELEKIFQFINSDTIKTWKKIEKMKRQIIMGDHIEEIFNITVGHEKVIPLILCANTMKTL